MYLLTNIYSLMHWEGFYCIANCKNKYQKKKHLLTGGLWWALVLVGLYDAIAYKVHDAMPYNVHDVTPYKVYDAIA